METTYLRRVVEIIKRNGVRYTTVREDMEIVAVEQN